MGEPSVHWEIQEDYTFEENPGKVSWIVKKGLVLVKKILATGVVISSAPIFLPPLLIISARSFAVSIPSGLFLASYACPEKLMAGFDGEIDMEEEELIEDSGGGAARRFDFPLSGAGEGLEKFGSDSVLHDLSGIVQEGGQENVLESMDKRIQPEIEVDTRGTGVEIRDHPINEMQGIVLTIEADDRATLEGKGSSFEVTDAVVMESAGIENIEEEELARETTGLIEKLRDEGRDDRRELHEVADKGAQPELEKATGKNSEDVETPVEAKDAVRKGKKKGKEKEKIVEKRAEEEKRKQKENNNESASSARDVEAAGKAMKEQSQTDRLREEDKESANNAAVSALRTSAGNVLHSSQMVNGSAKTSETHPGEETNLPPYEASS